jgi:Velvet factor
MAKAILVSYDKREPISPVYSQGRDLVPLVGQTVAFVQHVIEPSEDDPDTYIHKGVFAFSDLSVRQEGMYRLMFHLYELVGDDVLYRASLESGTFRVYPAKEFPGMQHSTGKTVDLKNQGVRIRVKKNIRIAAGRARKMRVREPILNLVANDAFSNNILPTFAMKSMARLTYAAYMT